MTYKPLNGICISCYGCNLLENTWFRGKAKCSDYAYAQKIDVKGKLNQELSKVKSPFRFKV